MTLLEREARCRTEGCRRAPAVPGAAMCADHREKWLPAWRQRQLEDARLRGRVAVKELT